MRVCLYRVISFILILSAVRFITPSSETTSYCVYSQPFARSVFQRKRIYEAKSYSPRLYHGLIRETDFLGRTLRVRVPYIVIRRKRTVSSLLSTFKNSPTSRKSIDVQATASNRKWPPLKLRRRRRRMSGRRLLSRRFHHLFQNSRWIIVCRNDV